MKTFLRTILPVKLILKNLASKSYSERPRKSILGITLNNRHL